MKFITNLAELNLSIATSFLASFELDPGGILLYGDCAQDMEAAQQRFRSRLAALKLEQGVQVQAYGKRGDRFVSGFRLDAICAGAWAPDGDTLQLCQQLGLHSQDNADDLEREILLAMLLAPVAFAFPGYEELSAAVRIRKNIVTAGRKTTLAFDTDEAERPEEYWIYNETSGFTVKPGKSLIEALQKATQPESSGELYSFSCYRATEYVILLGIAQELVTANPGLLQQLQRQWQRRAIMSGKFHEVFLCEYGSMSTPLPARYYVPGDRLWFRNPDELSSDVMGYEGSWVLYLGSGLFTNFWKRHAPYTLTTKCLELYHWRNATYLDAQGKLRIDEAAVETHVAATLQDAREIERILEYMLRFRDEQGVYAEGGCIDTSREYPQWVCPVTTTISLPDI
ncbi:MAG: hypothetical protein ACYCSS_11670 [Sulfuriferula sp.]